MFPDNRGLCVSVFSQGGGNCGGTLWLLLQRHAGAFTAAGRRCQNLHQDLQRMVEGGGRRQGRLAVGSCNYGKCLHNCSVETLCEFSALWLQVGWFPSTYVEEEDWLCWLNDIFSKPIPSSESSAAHPLSALSQISLIKPRLGLKTKRQCPQKPSPALWQTLTRSRCQITDSRLVAPYLASLQPCLPPRPTGKCMCCSQITPPYPLTFSYYWWLHWLVGDLPSLSSCFDTRKAKSPNWNIDLADSAPPRYAAALKFRSRGARPGLEHYSFQLYV